MRWSQTGGEAKHFSGRCLAIDEIHNVIDFLERMETTSEVRNVDFLELSDCVFMQRNMEKHGKLDQEHAFRIVEKTWGKDRLNKDCYKKGAKYEGL